MNKQEIKDLVAAKIAGQGNQVDLGSALPKIIDEVVDLIPEGGGGPVIVEVQHIFPELTEEERNQILDAVKDNPGGITVKMPNAAAPGGYSYHNSIAYVPILTPGYATFEGAVFVSAASAESGSLEVTFDKVWRP